MRLVLIATEWGTSHGGINAFNRDFAVGLAKVGHPNVQIIVTVLSATEEAKAEAKDLGVTLVPIASDARDRPTLNAAREVQQWLAAHAQSTHVDLWVGHDVITGHAAVAAAKLCGRAAIIHHMRYLSYQNVWGGNGPKAFENDIEQATLFSASNAMMFGVGTTLTRSAEQLSGKHAVCLIPGFPKIDKSNSAGNEQLRITVAGRFDTDAEPLKQSQLAAEALGYAVRISERRYPTLRRPEMVIMGVDPSRINAGELEQLANERAGRKIAVVPTFFNNRSGATIDQLLRSNLAIMPSLREGFGLVGWEAIGCGVPLILGEDTGLCEFIHESLGSAYRACLKPVSIGGTNKEDDVRGIANAIVEIASNLSGARKDARYLRDSLSNEFGCTWQSTADEFLHAVAEENVISSPPYRGKSPQQQPVAEPPVPASHPNFCSWAQDYFPECAELNLSTSQGSTARRFDVLAELRFGIDEFTEDGLAVSAGVKSARLQLTVADGRIKGERLGDNPSQTPGISALAGGVWILSPLPGDKLLKGKLLGDETLCRIETPPNTAAAAAVNVMANAKDIDLTFRELHGKAPDVMIDKVMGVFLKKALYHARSGQVILSAAKLEKGDDAK